LNIPLPLTSQVRSSKAKKYLDYPHKGLLPKRLDHFQGLSLLQGTPHNSCSA
jgi:hypothetical protein